MCSALVLKTVLYVTVTATRLVSYGPDDQDGEEEEEEEGQHASEDEMFSQFKSPSGVSTGKEIRKETVLEHL